MKTKIIYFRINFPADFLLTTSTKGGLIIKCFYLVIELIFYEVRALSHHDKFTDLALGKMIKLEIRMGEKNILFQFNTFVVF